MAIHLNQRPPSKYAHGRRGLTVIELLAIVIILALLASVLWPSMSRTRCGGLSRRLVCASNVKGLGTAMKIYAHDNSTQWPIVPFDETRIGQIDYTVPTGGGAGTPISPDRTQPSLGGPGGARQLSVTRAMWMLVRSGDVTLRQFICPTSGDTFANEADIDKHYDFASSANVSYGYQIPYGPAGTRASESIDPRLAVAADKGPYRDATVKPPPKSLLAPNTDPKAWRPYNSGNHGSEGQNVLYGDGHASFVKRPIIGVDGDNIYTVATGNSAPEEFMIGESPWANSAPPFLPLDTNGIPQATTDSVIFP